MSNHSDSKQVTVNGQVSATGASSPALKIRRRFDGKKASDALLSPMALMALGLAGAASVNAQTVSSDDSAESSDRLQALEPGLEEQVVLAADDVAAADAPVSAELQEPAVLVNDGAEAAMLAMADADILPIDFAAQVNQLAVAADAYAPVLMAQASVVPYAAAEPAAASAAAAAPAVAAESGISWTMIAAGAAALVGVAVSASSSSKDSTPPVAPGLALTTDTGSSSSDGISKTGTFNVTGLEVGAIWAYSKDSGSTWTTGTGTTFTLTDGAYAASAIQVRQTDTAGNVSLTTGKNAAAITIDNVIAATTVALLNDTGSLSTDKLTNSALLSLNTAASDVTRTYSVDSGTASGTYTAPTTDGSHTVVVTDTDTAGNTSTASLTFTLDKTIAKPTVALTNDTGSSLTDMITSSALLTLSAKAGDVTRTYSVDSGTASSTYTAPTVNGSHTVIVTDTDTAGNTASSTTLTFTLDTVAPTAAVTRTGTDALALNASGSLTITFDAAVTGFTAADLVDAKGGTFANLVTSDAGKTWTVDFTPNPDKLGPASITVLNASYTDIAGNSGSASAALAVSYFANTTATDGYISGGNVYLDIDKSGTVTTGDTLVGTTLANGSVSVALSSGQDAYDLLVTGGTDVSTGLAFAGLLRAPAGSTIISPLTTLVQAVMSADTSSLSTAAKLAAAQATVITALSLPTGVDLTSYDPFEVALGSGTAAQKAIAVAVQSQAIVVANLLVAGSAALQGAATTAGGVTAVGASSAIIGALVTQISSGTAVNLNSSATLGTLLTSAATNTSIASSLSATTTATLITAASTSLAVSNQAVSDAMTLAASNVTAGTSSNQFLASLTDAVQVQTVAQGTVSTQLAAGTAVTLTTTTLATAADAVTTAQLTTTQAGVADTTAPSAPVAKLNLDSGSSASDGITKTGTIDVTGFETGATWQYSTDAGATWTTGSGTSFTLAAGTYVANALQVRQTDATGNVSDLGKITTATTVDQTIATPTLAAVDTGTSATDGITNSGVVNVTGIETGASWEYSSNAGTSWSTGSGTSFTLVAGSYAASAVQVRVTDIAGNISTAGAITSALVVDQTGSAATLVAATTVSSTGGELYGFNFSEAVTGFDLTDITVVNGVASAFTTVDSSHYTAVITPNSSTAPLSMTVNVAAGAATDAAGNSSTAAAQILHSVLWGTSGNDSLTVGTAADTVYLGSAGTDTVVMTAATGSTAAALDKVYGFGSGDLLDLKAILGTGGSGYTSTAVADTGAGFVELKNLTLVQNTVNSTTTVKFDVNFDAATISSSKITGAVIDLVYDYSKVSAALVTNTTFVDPTFGTNVNVWANVVSNLATSATVTANGKIALTADLSTSVNPIIDTSGKAFGVTLIVNSLVTTFSIGLESVASGGSTSIVTANNVTSNVDVGITGTAGASLGSTGVLQIVADANGALTTVTDNQFHMATSYDSVNKVTHLLVQYDTNSTFGTTSLSNVIAMDFDGDVTTTLVPASLTYTFP